MLGTAESPSLPDAAAPLQDIFITCGRDLEERRPDTQRRSKRVQRADVRERAGGCHEQ